MSSDTERTQETTVDAEVLIVGAGITGIYQLYTLREAGVDAALVEAAPGVGGTWYWNRYPDARSDSESHSYGYVFSRDLFEEWKWSERFAGQPEIERYLNHVVDRFRLRDLMTFDFRVQSMDFDDDRRLWTVRSTSGDERRARFVITAVGTLSAPFIPDLAGRDRFGGEQRHTGEWPVTGVELAGRRVGVVGTGSSGIQIVPAIAETVSELLVFQRTANWACPAGNGPISDAEHAEVSERFEQFRRSLRETYGGFVHAGLERSAFEDTPEQRRALYEELWARPGLSATFSNYQDVSFDAEANREFCDFIAEQIRAIVDDPATAEKLIPQDHGFGAKRVPLESGFYEAFNRADVSLVDLRSEPLVEVTERGLRTAAREYDLDVIVWATGYDAVTGSLTRMDIRAGTTTLADAWRDGITTYLGLQVSGFPNLFIAGGPSTFGNSPRSSEDQVDFITELVTHALREGHGRVDAARHAEDEWTEHTVDLVADLPIADSAWWLGGNIPGKARRVLVYAGGLPEYRRRVREVARAEFEGFEFSDAPPDREAGRPPLHG